MDINEKAVLLSTTENGPNEEYFLVLVPDTKAPSRRSYDLKSYPVVVTGTTGENPWIISGYISDDRVSQLCLGLRFSERSVVSVWETCVPCVT